jgi:hypothetical protein
MTAVSRLLIASGIATVIALLLAVPSVWGIETWKWIMGVIGLALIILAGRKDRSLGKKGSATNLNSSRGSR